MFNLTGDSDHRLKLFRMQQFSSIYNRCLLATAPTKAKYNPTAARAAIKHSNYKNINTNGQCRCG